MTRAILDESHIHPAIRQKIRDHHRDIVAGVQGAIAANCVVVIGMTQSSHPKSARNALDATGVPYKYSQYGSYLSGWRRRNALTIYRDPQIE